MRNETAKKRGLQALREELRIAQQQTSKEEIKKGNQDNLMQDKINRLMRRHLMARPTYRQLRQWPDPKIDGPFEISPAALRAKMTSRLEYLAQPRPENTIFLETYFPKPKKGKPKFKEISSRLLELSKPKPMSLYIDNTSTYMFKNPRTINTPKQRLSFYNNLKRLSAPRQTPLSYFESEQIKKPLSELLPRIEQLSQPARRPPNNNELTYEELYTIKKSALTYNATDRTKKLATPKKLSEETLLNLNYNPRKNLLKSMKYKATERTLELAKPIIRQATKSLDLKEDAFKINPKALKARCSKRIKELAKPVKRRSSQPTMTTYRLAYRNKSTAVKQRSSTIAPSAADNRVEQLLKNRLTDNDVRPEIAIRVYADARLSTYKRDFVVPIRVPTSPEPVGRPPSPQRDAVSARMACGRLMTASPHTNVKYTGAAPPEAYVEPRSEYWSSHCQLAERIIAERLIPKRTRRCFNCL